MPPRHHRRESGQHHGAEVPVDPDRVQGGDRVHDLTLGGGQVNSHHQDPVIAASVAADATDPADQLVRMMRAFIRQGVESDAFNALNVTAAGRAALAARA